ncbi:MAG: UDP-3-O-acyl-N-acetylglucosamine deacetylase [Deltaproteobacteria bacterium]|nr:UDP-3-O-acyl-N-acetylglucosamine deacetylase [Deltaproteobacteria bacterium]MCL5277755.1 UDP-3-O-acyl-N-acetylglucosamine deacetylase [Deltaproteobacteria bacterium]
MFKRTLKRKTVCAGYGLHTGEFSRIVIHPGSERDSILFVKKVGNVLRYLPLRSSRVKSTMFATTIGNDDFTVLTVEHLLSALHGFGVDSAIIEVEGDEVPGGDGSASLFADAILDAGIFTLTAKKENILIETPLKVEHNTGYIEYSPASTLVIDGVIDFNHPRILRQHYTYHNSPEHFYSELAKARTFGFLKDYATMQSLGLAKGSSMENTVVLDEKEVMNADGLRFQDEFVRHKVLDMLGDLYTLGSPLKGHITSYKSGHALNHIFVNKIAALMEKKALSHQQALQPALVFTV